MPRHALRPLDRVEIASPCDASWDAMEGNERVRFCQHCSLNVHDTSQMTPAAAFNLVLRSGGRLCLRVHRRPDGSLATRTPPAPLYQIRRRASRVAAGAFGAALTLCSAAAAHAQARPATAPHAAERTLNATPSAAGGGALSGTVTVPHGAVVPNVRTTLINDQNGTRQESVTDSEGVYRFDGLVDGAYTLLLEGPPGFVPTTIRNITMQTGSQQTADAQLELGDELVLGGVVAVVEPVEPLVKAASENDLAAVRALLAGGADVNVVDETVGVSALAVAVNQGNRELVAELLRAGAKVNLRLAYRQTALMRIGQNTTGDIVRALLLAGAKVNLRDEDGNTALMTAAAYAPTEVVELLLKAGARADARAKNGETPLMYAARAGATENARALLSAGADLDARSGEDTTALKLAREYDHEETAGLLVAYGASDDEPPEEADGQEEAAAAAATPQP
jgi:hypothetical protein